VQWAREVKIYLDTITGPSRELQFNLRRKESHLLRYDQRAVPKATVNFSDGLQDTALFVQFGS